MLHAPYRTLFIVAMLCYALFTSGLMPVLPQPANRSSPSRVFPQPSSTIALLQCHLIASSTGLANETRPMRAEVG